MPVRSKRIPYLAALCAGAVALIVVFSLLHSPAARAQSATFQVAQHGHAVGTASFAITAAPGGYHSTSLVRVSMQGLAYALSKDERLTAAHHLVQAQLSATVNSSAVELTAKPQSGQVQLDISANGRKSSTRLPGHAGAVLLPDFDPGGLQTLLTLAVRQNSRDLWAIIPRRAGSMDAVQLATYQDMQGTLNGNPVTVHHLVATIGGVKTDLFSGPQNQLLQAELPQEGFALVRQGFVLKPPAKAPAAPPQQPASSQPPPSTQE